MMDKDYFESNAIGSSLLANCIAGTDPLRMCCDRATKEIKPTSSMSMGKKFEDLTEANFGKLDFWGKYFKSDLNSIPESSKQPSIMEALDLEGEARKAAIDAMPYIYGKPKKKGEAPPLNKTYANRHRCLDQIKRHDYRMPVTVPEWESVEIMLERFKNFPLKLQGATKTLDEWMVDYMDVLFQVEHFWKTGDAYCRAKFDMIWLMEWQGETWAIPFDLKATADEVGGLKSIGVFQKFWRTKYVWQYVHYYSGFLLWCEENDYRPWPSMWYVIQESQSPHITHAQALHESEAEAMRPDYLAALEIIQKWIDDGKPVRGYMPQRIVNRYGREWRNYEEVSDKPEMI